MKPLRSAHLLWSEGFAQRTAASIAAIAILAYGVATTPSLAIPLENAQSGLRYAMLRAAHSYAWWAAVGLLSSACCVLQLGLNILAVGCGGLNSFLGPWRPVGLALCLALNAWAWAEAWHRPILHRQAATASVLSLCQAILPELFFAVAKLRAGGGQGSHDAGQDRSSDRGSDRGSGGEATGEVAFVALQVGQLGCSACLTAVSAAACAVPGVVSCDASVETGVAVLGVATAFRGASSSDGGTAPVAEAAAAALAARGYPASVLAAGAPEASLMSPALASHGGEAEEGEETGFEGASASAHREQPSHPEGGVRRRASSRTTCAAQGGSSTRTSKSLAQLPTRC